MARVVNALIKLESSYVYASLTPLALMELVSIPDALEVKK